MERGNRNLKCFLGLHNTRSRSPNQNRKLQQEMILKSQREDHARILHMQQQQRQQQLQQQQQQQHQNSFHSNDQEGNVEMLKPTSIS